MAETKKTTEKAEVKAAAPKKVAPKKVEVKEVKKEAPKKTEVKETKKEAPKKTEAKTDKKIKVTLVRSTIAELAVHKATVEALGLHKIRQFKIHPDNAAMRGMCFKVKHLVKVEEVK